MAGRLPETLACKVDAVRGAGRRVPLYERGTLRHVSQNFGLLSSQVRRENYEKVYESK